MASVLPSESGTPTSAFASRRASTTSARPLTAAHVSGVQPLLFLALRATSLEHKNLTTGTWFPLAAKCRAVFLLLHEAS
eukprot:CAMPEP_0115738046 /NCGR_PEP_ID=MMETSP0272-20121206/88163_1 /TAXON_ID=71861 /ORGANISM="Scrippsiella trochoidea, Strain CCMP3099" /LENGTH=78 /DNA_ID=CAMNT_0003182431 /DNA_START=64 /DNA_END=296 /DNA_ORIENTATION=+